MEIDRLYDIEVLEELNFSDIKPELMQVTSTCPGIGLKVRPLEASDYKTGFLDLLSQLTKVGDITQEKFTETYKKMKTLKGMYYVTVIEDTKINKIIAAGTLLIEQKFIHECALRGRIEDIVVDTEYRGKQLGKLIVMTLTLLAEKMTCYKVTLDCNDKMKPFYESLGFKREESNSNFMQIRFRS